MSLPNLVSVWFLFLTSRIKILVTVGYFFLVTGSSSQENCSSGQSYGSFSSPEENDQETPPKSKTWIKNAVRKQTESKTSTKVRNSCSPKKKHRKKKKQKTQAFIFSKGSGTTNPNEGQLHALSDGFHWST